MFFAGGESVAGDCEEVEMPEELAVGGGGERLQLEEEEREC